jgi:hypothetical protein
MVKGKINSEILVLGLVAIVSITAIFFITNMGNNIIGEAKGGWFSRSCSDSDNGLNYYVKGSVSGAMPRNFDPVDSCYSPTLLRETYCGSNNYATAVQYTCVYGCLNGVCNQAPTGSYCGDVVIDSGESCDGSNLGGKSCVDFGFVSGTLACNSSCKFDTKQCSMCNNNAVCELRLGETAVNCKNDCVVSPTGPAIYFTPGTADINNGDLINLEIWASGITNLFAYQFDISYNPTILQFNGLQEGTLLNNGTTGIFCLNYTLSSGLVKRIVCTRTSKSGVSGKGLLKTVSFRAIAPGTSDVIIANAKISNPNSLSISSTFINSKVVVR